ncbi:hypothetical protein [Pseudomonas sp. DSV-1]|uniref:hypothetical protein n=1 Tax=Pseudomonas sp. DSV-1 TaxID=3112250 RepID=UPI002DBD0A5F|nr:hypothetical protein [Pseudomonas sp. DSV-1]MEC4242079.1 hypothetical protein [Pseudomonas sp. DSV-1]
MTFSIASHFDQLYSCPTCDRDQLKRNADFDVRTWTCVARHQPVRIEISDRGGNSYHVERRLVQQLLAGDQLVYLRPGGRLDIGEVKASSPSTGKCKRWFLAVELFGHDLIELDSYVNIL